MKNEEDFSRAAWMRAAVLRNPNIDLEGLQKEYDKDKSNPKDKRPDVVQVIYQARTELCKRWGVASMEEFPRNKEGKINTAGMIRLLLDQKGIESVYKKALAFFEKDGLTMTSGVYSNQKSVYTKKQTDAPLESSSDSPDVNQNNGPRAGKPRRQYKKRAVKPTTDGVDFSALLVLKNCVTKLGGYDNARQALKTLEQLQELQN
jgi:hypothetical protein